MNYWNEWEGFGQEYPDQAPQPEEQKQPGWYPEQRGPYEMYWDGKEYTQIRSAQAPQQAEPTQQTTRKNYTTTPLAAPIEPTQTHSEAPKAPQIEASRAADPMPSWWKTAQAAAKPLQQKLATESKGISRKKIIAVVSAAALGVVLLLALIIAAAANSHSDGYYACVKTNSAEFNWQGDPEIRDSLESYCGQLEDMGLLG